MFMEQIQSLTQIKRKGTTSEKEYQMKQNRKENKPIEKKEKEIKFKKSIQKSKWKRDTKLQVE